MRNNIEELHKQLKEALKEWIKFANKYDINYSLSSGNLLGAARHKGFIPWDDDLDLDVPINEIEKIKINKHELPKNMEFVWEKHRVHPRIYIRNIDVNYFGHKNNLWIDIFPQYKTNDNNFGKNKRGGMISSNFLFAQRNPFVKSWVKILRSPLNIFPPKFVRLIHNKIVKKHSDKNGKYIFQALTNGFTTQSCNFENIIEIEFEGLKVKAYSNYEDYLNTMYGDWKKIPEVKDRQSHNLEILAIRKK